MVSSSSTTSSSTAPNTHNQQLLATLRAMGLKAAHISSSTSEVHVSFQDMTLIIDIHTRAHIITGLLHEEDWCEANASSSASLEQKVYYHKSKVKLPLYSFKIFVTSSKLIAICLWVHFISFYRFTFIAVCKVSEP